jgi:site-specific DNA-methyltransferase (adenine-specific)
MTPDAEARIGAYREPYWADEDVRLYAGDALGVLAALPDASVDAVITDPPYSSGGQFRSDRMGDTHTKYVNSDSGTGNALTAFGGDNRDQRAYGYWCALWLGECLRVTKPGGTCLLFTDWRQLPTTTDALQAGGWIWRGIVPWVKPGARPQAGRFTAACEYVVWGSAGPMALELGDACLPGFYQVIAPRDREHIAQKPIKVMRDLVKIAPGGGLVLDPFMGAGTTGVAAVIEGRKFIGAEQEPHFQQVSRERIVAAKVGYRDDGVQMALEAS